MNSLVTGATGFLGTRVIERLSNVHTSIRCLVRKSSNVDSLCQNENGHKVSIIRGSLDNYESCLEAMAGCDTVYHLAAEVKGSTAVLFMSNVVSTRVLVRAALEAKVKRFVLVSSLGVYGPQHLRHRGVLDESCPIDTNPAKRDPYTFSKIRQESICWDAYRDHGLPLVVIRPGVIYGPSRDIITSRIGLKISKYLFVMAGRRALPYVHVSNCADAIVLAGNTPALEGKAINVIDDDLPTGRDLAKLFRSKIGGLRCLSIPRGMIGVFSRFNEWYHRASNGQIPLILTKHRCDAMWKNLQFPNDRAKNLLGWKPAVGSEQGIQESITWLLQNKHRSADQL